MGVMTALGYTEIVQDRSKSKFTICNATFFQSNKLCHTWTESRSRALVTGFKLLPDKELAAVAASSSAAAAGSTGGGGDRVDAQHKTPAARGTGENVQTATMATLAAGAPLSTDDVNGAAVKGDAAAVGDGGGSMGTAEVFIANCHLEGHPWKAQERFNQVKGVLARMERRQSEIGAPMDDARILVVGVPYSTCNIYLCGCRCCCCPWQICEFSRHCCDRGSHRDALGARCRGLQQRAQ